ncbi:MAG: transcription antitermination factor NusB [Planctomycetes bacterium]|nr:transcription antitermination factor NusB [Planctomycetota bacterium]
MRRRTRARELALQFLYTYEMRGEEAVADLVPFITHHTKIGANIAEDGLEQGTHTGQRAEVASYAEEISRGVHDHMVELNNWIEHIARNWRLDRMAYLDRNILRIALYELLFQTDVPFKVVINEAIDMAKRYSTSQSGSFVNGILDRAAVLIKEARAKGTTSIPSAPADSSESASKLAAAESGNAGAEGHAAATGNHADAAPPSSMVPPERQNVDEPGGGASHPNADVPTPRPTHRRMKRRPVRRWEKTEES